MPESTETNALAMRVGTAGWSLPRAHWPMFPAEGSHLERYAQRLGIAEINTSFYRPHRMEVYARWAAATPTDFRFSVKLPKTISHEKRLVDADAECAAFMEQVSGLGDKLACVLVQLPPSLAFDGQVVATFLERLRSTHAGDMALEPRHASWFTPEADAMLDEHRVARVLADPVLHANGERPGGWPQLVYLRLHGTPRVYWSAYETELIDRLAARLKRAKDEGARSICIFDNTAGGEAAGNAVALQRALS